MDSYYIRNRGRVTGPFDELVLRRMIARGHVTRIHELSTDGIKWSPATNFPEFALSGSGSAPHFNTQNTASKTADSPQETSYLSGGASVGSAVPRASESRRKSGSSLVRRGVAIALGLALSLLIIFVVQGTWSSPAPAVREEELYAKLQSSVGRVIVGAKGTVNKNYLEMPFARGTAFLVSERGYYLTNRHVIESHIPYHEDAGLARRESSAISVDQGVPIDVQSQIWLLIAGQKYSCELIYFSDDFDLAVLRAKVAPGATGLALSTKKSHAPPALVYAAGYPAVNDVPLSEEAEIKNLVHAKTSDVKSQFSAQALTLQVNSGSVNLTFTGDQQVQTIKHQAVVNPGNSGGPLLNAAGVVIGINTEVSRINKGTTFEAASYAPIIAQMRREIEQHVPGVRWQD